MNEHVQSNMVVTYRALIPDQHADAEGATFGEFLHDFDEADGREEIAPREVSDVFDIVALVGRWDRPSRSTEHRVFWAIRL